MLQLDVLQSSETLPSMICLDSVDDKLGLEPGKRRLQSHARGGPSSFPESSTTERLPEAGWWCVQLRFMRGWNRS